MKVLQHYTLEIEEDDNLDQVLSTLRHQNIEYELYEDDGMIEVYGDYATPAVNVAILKELNFKKAGK